MINEYFYCGAYQAFLMALYLKKGGKNIIIITHNKDIVKLCSKLSLDFIEIPSYTERDFIFKPKEVRKKVSDVCKLINNGVFHFSHSQWDILCYIFIKNLKKKSEINFYNFEFDYQELRGVSFSLLFFKSIIIHLIIKTIYKIDIIIKQYNNIIVPGINKQIIEKNGINYIDNKSLYFEKIDSIIKEFQISLKTFNYLFLEEGILYYQENSDNQSIVELINLLNELDIVLKGHPNRGDKEHFKINKDVFPSFYPVELLYSNIKKAVLSVSSVALVSATKFENLKVISLINLLKWQDESKKSTLIKSLEEKSNGRILFPKTKQELFELLD